MENASRQPIDEATRQLIDKLLLEQLALAAIARVTGEASAMVTNVRQSKVLSDTQAGGSRSKKSPAAGVS